MGVGFGKSTDIICQVKLLIMPKFLKMVTFPGSESTTWAEQRSEIASPGAALPLTTSFSMLTMTDTEIVLQRVQAVKDLIVNCEYGRM